MQAVACKTWPDADKILIKRRLYKTNEKAPSQQPIIPFDCERSKSELETQKGLDRKRVSL